MRCHFIMVTATVKGLGRIGGRRICAILQGYVQRLVVARQEVSMRWEWVWAAWEQLMATCTVRNPVTADTLALPACSAGQVFTVTPHNTDEPGWLLWGTPLVRVIPIAIPMRGVFTGTVAMADRRRTPMLPGVEVILQHAVTSLTNTTTFPMKTKTTTASAIATVTMIIADPDAGGTDLTTRTTTMTMKMMRTNTVMMIMTLRMRTMISTSHGTGLGRIIKTGMGMDIGGETTSIMPSSVK
ncbi:hypothetical protein CC80DRAFT_178750 [Byssothecium circinans]|uniref:Uncharacterized protein n=1 Tax=Byssothecium circinans TaxID=147558 RepID=A0A6A5TKU3_9PLEO|nr:hypothetical protein CC80DRAFT_178750 [Byssothecium circinans]